MSLRGKLAIGFVAVHLCLVLGILVGLPWVPLEAPVLIPVVGLGRAIGAGQELSRFVVESWLAPALGRNAINPVTVVIAGFIWAAEGWALGAWLDRKRRKLRQSADRS